MIKICQSDAKGTNRAQHYQLAGVDILVQSEIPTLAEFWSGAATEAEACGFDNDSGAQQLNEANAQLLYSGQAPFANQISDVQFWSAKGLRQIDVMGEAVCQIDIINQHILLLNDRPFEDSLNLEVITGPALILLLSYQNCFCLHAGAVATPFGNIALIAESGTGKSTLSRHIDTNWRQLADDILPLQLAGDATCIVPAFPQLKLPNANVPYPDKSSVSLDLILRLTNVQVEQVHFSELAKPQATMQIVRHTVAAKLFDRQQLHAHMQFAADLLETVAVVELSYPRVLSELSDLRDNITEFVRTIKVD